MPVINAGMTYLPALVAGGVTLNSFRDEKPSSNRLPLDKQVDNKITFSQSTPEGWRETWVKSWEYTDA